MRKWVATQNSPRCFQKAFYKSVFFNGLVAIHAAGWSKWAVSVRKKSFLWTMVWRKSALVETDKFEGKVLRDGNNFHTTKVDSDEGQR